MCCKKAVLTILGTSMWIEICQSHGQDSRSSQYRMRNFLQEMWGRRSGLQQIRAPARPDHLWPATWFGMSKAAQRNEEQQWAIDEPKARQCAKLERHPLHWSDKWRVQGNLSEGTVKVGDSDGSGHAFWAEHDPASQQLALMKQRLIYQTYSMCLYREMTLRISIQDGTKLYYLQVTYRRKMSWRCCTRWEYVNPAADRISNVWPRNLSRSSNANLSKTDDNGKKTYWSDDQDAQLWSQECKDGDRSIGQQSKWEECQRREENGRMLSVESKWTMF